MEESRSRIEHRHIEGLFSREVWMRKLSDVGFESNRILFELSELPARELEILLGMRPTE